jgi:acyl-coenzyme A synthetase/AMP-(fatty) acid ligase
MPFQRLGFIFDKSLSAANFIDRSIDRYGDRCFLTFAEPLLLDKSYSQMMASELLAAVNRCSNVLAERGTERHTRVAIWKANSPDYFVYGNAVIRAGGIAVPINGGMQVDTLIAYLNYAGAKILITDCERFDRLDAAGFRAHCRTLETVFVTDGVRDGCLSMPALMAAAGGAFRPVRLSSDDDILIVHTSGTTGTPKGVLHTNGSFVAGLKGILKMSAWVSRDERLLGAMPYNHYIAFQTIGAALVTGNNGLLVSMPTAPLMLNLIQKFRPAAIFSFPHVYVEMYDHGMKDHDLSSVKLWMAGADSSHEAHIREFVKNGSMIKLFGKTLLPSLYIDTLGTSEVGFPAFRRISSKYSTLFSRCIGRSMSAGPRVKVADEHGDVLAPMQVGRLMVKGATLFKGYWNAHERLHGVVKDGWWWTGDLGYRDRKGRYFHLDRDVDLVRTRYGDLSTLLLEEHILKHPSVSEAVVVARTLADGDTVPHVYVQVRRGALATVSELLRWTKAGLPADTAPVAEHISLQLIESRQIPRGLTGKILKRELRRQLETA